MDNINDSHSLIIDYPIDYNLFPQANNTKIYKVELNKNEYIIIPKFWFHWVYTDPKTISISYEIPTVDFISHQNNHFNDSINSSSPYKGIHNIADIKYDDFINSSLNENYKAIISETSDCSPVIKNRSSKYYYNNTLSNIISRNNNNYVYIGHNSIHQTNMLYSFSDIKTIINRKYYNHIYYKSTVWFTLDKIINSGLHLDSTNNIIYVLDGKKTIYLIHPNSVNNLYIRNMQAIPTIPTIPTID